MPACVSRPSAARPLLATRPDVASTGAAVTPLTPALSVSDSSNDALTATPDDCISLQSAAKARDRIGDDAGGDPGVARELAHYDQEPMAIPSSRILLRGHERVTWAARRSALGPSGSVRPMRMTSAARSRQRAWGESRVCGRGRRVFVGAVALMLAGVLGSCGSTAAAPDPASVSQTLRFRVVAKTTQKLDSVVWTGQQFLYVQNTANTVWAAPPAGRPLHRFATMPRLVEETRCVLSVGRHGFASGAIFCHSPDNKIYEISADGSRETVFATLPAHYPPAADGALAFDTVGRFGYRLLAATGRSGGTKPAGGQVDAVDSHGRVQRVGATPGRGAQTSL